MLTSGFACAFPQPQTLSSAGRHTIIRHTMSIRLVEGASDGCWPKLHRWPFSVLSLMSHSIPLQISPTFLQNREQKRGLLGGRPPRRMPAQCERTSEALQACLLTASTFLSSNLIGLSYASCAQRASLFPGFRSVVPRCGLHAVTFCASIPWEIKAMQGTHAH